MPDFRSPEVRAKLDEWLSEAPEREEVLKKFVLTQLAQQLDNEQGFEAFYELVHGREMPPHTREWVEGVYVAREEGKGIVVQAFRGSTKTTVMTITFTAWRIGKEPERANLLIQVGDDIAQDNTSAIADIIANNPGWKLVFPHVVPDFERGWGAGGYEVKRTDIEYTAWRERNTARKDPTLVGVGYKSREIIGKHPDGVLVVDDIHDENNTSSERELGTVRKILTGTIFPTMTPDSWKIFIGTPWVESDVLHYAASTGQFTTMRTPVCVPADDEEGGVIYAWPDKFSGVEVSKQRDLSGPIEFARMYLLDLTATHNRVFQFMTFPNSEVRYTWPMVGGVDYASSASEAKNAEGKGDYFAMAYVAKLPGGGCVVVDGVLDRCTQAQAEIYLNRAQDAFVNWSTTAVEAIGKGDDFYQVIKRNPKLRVLPMLPGTRKKERRLEVEMAPWLFNGIVRISDAETPFLVELRRELSEYPSHRHDDAMDALYYALRLLPDVLHMPTVGDELPSPYTSVTKRRQHPAYALGRR